MANMVKIKVAEAEGPALEWLVAKCLGHKVYIDLPKYLNSPAGNNAVYIGDCHYSTNWAQGGPVKSANRISTYVKHDGWWVACIYNLNDDPEFVQIDQDELVAAMRCYVTWKRGPEVEVPEELLK